MTRSKDASWKRALNEAENVARRRLACHLTQSDLTAIRLLHRLYLEGDSDDLPVAHAALERMHIALATGKYPTHMLSAATPRPQGA